MYVVSWLFFFRQKTAYEMRISGWSSDVCSSDLAALDQVFSLAGLAPAAVDQVFMTGGSSFVPALQDLFAARFGAARLATGDQLQSIASGLALIGLEQDAMPWLAPADRKSTRLNSSH